MLVFVRTGYVLRQTEGTEMEDSILRYLGKQEWQEIS